jgi:lipoyl(octanoyl) transferase
MTADLLSNSVLIRSFSSPQDYHVCWQAMKDFTNQRTEETPDEIWLLQHHPVFTQGQNGKAEHVLNPGAIPIVQSDRGGQVTYHGPGQLIIYTLIDVKRKKLNVRELVTLLEQSVIQLLAKYEIEAAAQCKAPGVYVNKRKICSIGLRIRRGCSYHGLALNIDMDLGPFSRINPCGFEGLEMVQLKDLNTQLGIQHTGLELIEYLTSNLGYNSQHIKAE